MTENELKMIVASLGFGGFFMGRAILRNRITRKIMDTPRSKVATAPQGYVELQGFAWPASESVVDCSGDECVYYRLEIQRSETRGSGKNRRKEWVTLFEVGHRKPFYLVDGTGLALVDPTVSELDMEGARKRRWRSLSAEERSRIASFVSGRHLPGFPPSDSFFGLFANEYRVVEEEIKVGSPLYLHGDFRSIQAAVQKIRAPGLTEFFSRVFDSERKSLKNLSHLLDRDRDGRITAPESREGYSFAARRSREKAKGQISEEKDFEIFGYMGSSEAHRLLVADLHEEQLVARRDRFFWLQFVGGAALLAFGIARLLSVIGAG